ncbi:hypothetical protein [Enterococcus casseliflavus]|uniref:hypothetical protein n=1 Tax=Enterococcus casseliflavus TaxID=37734 RepID=UPI001CA7BF6B|nr:hypothetical protein [Enterococcus casseliflavus]MBZ0324061.1 hypothetical protein [Enterococcus casseliflavus]
MSKKDFPILETVLRSMVIVIRPDVHGSGVVWFEPPVEGIWAKLIRLDDMYYKIEPNIDSGYRFTEKQISELMDWCQNLNI